MWQETGARVSALCLLSASGIGQDTPGAQTLLQTLEELRMPRGEVRDPLWRLEEAGRLDLGYAEAFSEHGVPVDRTGVEAAVAALSGPSQGELAAYLVHWAAVRRRAPGEVRRVTHLLEIAERLDPDPWRRRLRAAFTSDGEVVEALRDLAGSEAIGRQPTASVLTLAGELESRAGLRESLEVYRSALALRPTDASLAFSLAVALERMTTPDWEEVARHYRAVLDLRADHREARHRLGVALRESGAHEEALALFRELADAEPDSAHWAWHIGWVLHKKGEQDAAVEQLTAAAALDPGFVRPINSLGNILYEERDYEAALARYREAVRLDPGFAFGHHNQGLALRRLGRMEESRQAYLAAISLAPEHASFHNGLGLTLRRMDRRGEAAESFRRALELAPDYAPAHTNLGLLRMDEADLEGAIEWYRKSLELNPEGAVALHNMGMAYRRMGDTETALECYLRVVEVDPDHAGAYNSIGIVLVGKGEYEEALENYRKALELNPAYAVVHRNIGLAHRRMGDGDKAVESFRKAVEVDPDYIAAYNSLGLALAAMGRDEEAIDVYREGLASDPGHVSSLHNLSRALQRIGDLKGQAASLERLVGIDPDHEQVSQELRVARQDLQQFEQTISPYREAVAASPGDPMAHLRLGFALRSFGRYAEALESLEEAHRLRALQQSELSDRTADYVRDTRELRTKEARWLDVASGRSRASSGEEWLEIARYFYDRTSYEDAATAFIRVLVTDAPLLKNAELQHRYHAARAAALAGAIRDTDTDDAGARWREQALTWLHADLAWWSSSVDGKPDLAPRASRVLQQWQIDPAFSHLRQAEELERLPESEVERWRRLWTDLAELLARIGG